MCEILAFVILYLHSKNVVTLNTYPKYTKPTLVCISNIKLNMKDLAILYWFFLIEFRAYHILVVAITRLAYYIMHHVANREQFWVQLRQVTKILFKGKQKCTP